MMTLNLEQLAEIVGGRLLLGEQPPLAGAAEPVSRIVTDSRRVQRGDVFWGLRGERHDGSHFAEEAMMRGAAGVVISGRAVTPFPGRFAIEVEDGHWSLWQLARHNRQCFEGTAIGVTGSVGKTTTRRMIAAVLGRRFEGVESPENYNNHIGLPLSLLQLQEVSEFGVFELGASKPGEMQRLASLCQVQIAVVPRLADAHLGGFGSQEAIVQEKTELLRALPSDGLAVLNGDDPLLRRIGETIDAEVIWVGRGCRCDLIAENVSFERSRLQFEVEGNKLTTELGGRHFLVSALAAYAVGREMGVPVGDIIAALAEFETPRQRCRLVERGGVTVIDDTYNSSPTAMRAALEAVRDIATTGRRIVVCGDMAELGPQTRVLHQQAGRQAVTIAAADFLLAAGQYAADVVAGARSAGLPAQRSLHFGDAEEAAVAAAELVQPGDVVLVKGSRHMEMEQVVDAIRPPQRAAA